MDCGADVIVTQLFYDTDIFLKFVNDCRQIGITIPIVPSIMPINNYKGFLRMIGFCKTKVCTFTAPSTWDDNYHDSLMSCTSVVTKKEYEFSVERFYLF